MAEALEARWVAFDVGETLIDESRAMGEWADLLEVDRLTFFAVLGSVIARGQDHRRVFDLVRPGFDWRSAPERAGAPHPNRIEPRDLYPDVKPAFTALAAEGYQIAVVGNQRRSMEADFGNLDLPIGLVAASERWGLEKPQPAFFRRLAEETGAAGASLTYVGDRIDNDIRPALAAGLRTVLLRRGPWAIVQLEQGLLPSDVPVIDQLTELSGLLA